MAKVSVLTEKQIELLHRIDSLDYKKIKRMSPEGLSRLTSEFHEPLVRALICKVTTNELQRELFRFIKNAYEQWMMSDPLWNSIIIGSSNKYPDYMNDMQLDLECGMVISKKGSSFPPITVQDNGEQKDSTTNASLELKVKELEEENARLKQENVELRTKGNVNMDEIIIELLTPLFKEEDEKVVEEFLEKVKDKDDMSVADVVCKYKNKYTPGIKKISIWRILHAFKLYRSSDRNFTAALRKREWR